ncbi:hypothetical protein FHS27_003319 [Rhodopirellula rubra]|uniref:Helix-turn-helix domain-containing protein n=1 Tax=Aporhodopirellula rubra TaxID=980271 RepID=A0A7W5DZN9_9BACT|nr:hypothetical protein [Aporhodopirellula rubra]MBB3207494.1 hypothetical protein [Aporhodopirellula rubra]
MNLESFTARPTDVAELFAVRGERRVDRNAKAKSVSVPLPRHRPGERFIRGPIPLTWFRAASTCGDRAEAVAVLLWYAAGYQRRNPIKMTPTLLSELRVHPKTGKRILRRMEELGLVQCEFARGRSPLVTITAPPTTFLQ